MIKNLLKLLMVIACILSFARAEDDDDEEEPKEEEGKKGKK